MAAYQKIKSSGPVGEKEGENIAKSFSSLNLAATKEDYDKSLNTLETSLRGLVELPSAK